VKLEAEDGLPCPPHNSLGGVNGGVLFGPNMQLDRTTRRDGKGAHQPTPSEGKVKYKTFLQTCAVSGKYTAEMDRIPWVLSVLDGWFHRLSSYLYC